MCYFMLHKDAKQKHLGCKKCGANQKHHCKQAGTTKRKLHTHIFTSMIGTYNSLYDEKGGQVTKPIILVKMCYNTVCHSRSY